MRGRKPLPSNVHELHGNPGKRKRAAREPDSEVKQLRMPPNLLEGEKKYWRYYSRLLASMRVLTEGDASALRILCEHYAIRDDAKDKLSKSPLVLKFPSGAYQQTPLLGIVNKQTEIISRLLIEFGMTPSSRTRVQVVQGAHDTDDPDGIF